MNLTRIVWTRPKRLGPEQNNFSRPKQFGLSKIILDLHIERGYWHETFFENMKKCNYYFTFLLSEFKGCADEDALISQYKVAQNDNQTLVIAGIVFNDDFDYVGNGDDKKMPDLDYKIRMNSREVVDLTQFTFTPYPMPPGPGRLFSKYS